MSNSLDQTVWFQIRPDILSGLIWVQTVCKGYQQMTKVTTSGERGNDAYVTCSDFLYKSIFYGYSFELLLQVHMCADNICYHKEVDNINCNMKPTKLLDCSLIGVSAVVKSNTVLLLHLRSSEHCKSELAYPLWCNVIHLLLQSGSSIEVRHVWFCGEITKRILILVHRFVAQLFCGATLFRNSL